MFVNTAGGALRGVQHRRGAAVHHPCKTRATCTSPNVPSLTSWPPEIQTHLSEYVLVAHYRLFGNRSPPAALQTCSAREEAARTARIFGSTDYKYVTAP